MFKKSVLYRASSAIGAWAMRFAKHEQKLKWLALALGIVSTIAIVQDWYPYTMFVSLPFCLIWVYCAWIHTERQLKYINIIFTLLYVYGIARYFIEK